MPLTKQKKTSTLEMSSEVDTATPIAIQTQNVGDVLTEAKSVKANKKSLPKEEVDTERKPLVDFTLIQDGIKPIEKKVSLADFDLDWRVDKLPMKYLRTVEGKQSSFSTPCFALVREDIELVLGAATKTYEPIQNEVIFDFMKKAFGDINLNLVNGFPIHGGKKIVLMAEIDGLEHVGNDSVKRYVYGLSSHDGSFALKFGFASKVLSCQNQFYKLSNGASMKLRHTKGAVVNRLEEFSKLVDVVIGQEKSLMQTFKILADTKLKPEVTNKVIQMLTETDAPMTPESIALLSSRKQNLVTTIRGAIDHEIATKGDTAWGLFNGVTWYFNHVKYRNKPEEERVDNLVIGYGNVKTRKSLDLILKEYGMNLN